MYSKFLCCSCNCSRKQLNLLVAADVNKKNQTDDLKCFVSHFSPTTDVVSNSNGPKYTNNNHRHVFTINADVFAASQPTISINPDLEYVTTITLYDDNTVSVMDASSYGLTLTDDNQLDDRSIWWLTEQIKRSFSNFSDVSAFLDFKRMSSGSSIPFSYNNQQQVALKTGKTNLGGGDSSNSTSFSSEKFALLKRTSTNSSLINELFARETPVKVRNDNKKCSYENDFSRECDDLSSAKHDDSVSSLTNDSSCGKQQLQHSTWGNKMRIRIEQTDGDGWAHQQYSSIITVEGEGGEPEIVYGKPKVYDTPSNLTCSQNSNTMYHHFVGSKNRPDLNRSKYDSHFSHQGYDGYQLKKRRRFKENNKKTSNFLSSTKIRDSSSPVHRKDDELISLNGRKANLYNENRRRQSPPQRNFFDTTYTFNRDYVHVDWWAINFLNSFNKTSSPTVNLNEPSNCENRPLFDEKTNKSQQNAQIPCCRFL